MPDFLLEGFRLTFHITSYYGLPELNAVLGFNDVATKDLVLIKITSEYVNCRQPDITDITVNTMLAFIDLTLDFPVGDFE